MSKTSRGNLITLQHDSDCLAGNRWQDPSRRDLNVYLPPGYDDSGSRRYPTIWYLAAYTNSGLSIGNWRGFDETLPQRLDRLIAAEQIGPVIVVAPDCFTKLGGNQYLDSPALGNYATYINDELIAFVDKHFKTLGEAAHRGVVGKSSGGYGAMHFGMTRPDRWGAVANQSGDAGFEWVYQPEFPAAAGVLARYQYDIGRFLDVFWQSRTRGGGDFTTLMCCCLAASYAPSGNLDLGFELPFDLRTLEIDDSAWQRWLACDPISLVGLHVAELSRLRGIYMDCGNRDQYNIHFGMRRLSRELHSLGIDHVYEEFDGTHSKIDHRLDVSLKYLYQHIS